MENHTPFSFSFAKTASSVFQRFWQVSFFTVFSVFLAASVCTASETANPIAKDDIPILSEGQQEVMDEKQKEVSTKLISAAEWLDSFFNDGRYTAEENKTRATLKLEFGYTKNDEFEIKPRVSLRMQFPNLTRKVNLLIQGADDEDFDVDGDPTNPGSDTDRGNLEAALQFFMFDSLKQNFSTSLGLSYDYVYAGVRYRYLKNWEKWSLRFTDRLRWYSDDGWENRASLDLERKISKNWMFRSITSSTWAEVEDGVPHSQIFRLYQVLSEERAILYDVSTYMDTDPDHHVTDVQVKFRYRQRFYRDWLVIEIAPQVTFPEEEGRDANPGLWIKLEADFGYESDDNVFNRIFKFN